MKVLADKAQSADMLLGAAIRVSWNSADRIADYQSPFGIFHFDRSELFVLAGKFECVVLPGRDLHSSAGRLYITAHDVQTIADDAHR